MEVERSQALIEVRLSDVIFRSYVEIIIDIKCICHFVILLSNSFE